MYGQVDLQAIGGCRWTGRAFTKGYAECGSRTFSAAGSHQNSVRWRRQSCFCGISERTFRRWRDRHREAGVARAAADRRLAPSLRRASMAEIERMLGAVSRPLPRLHGEAFPRAVGQTPRLYTRRSGDQAASASCWPGAGSDQAIGASQEAAASIRMVAVIVHQDASTPCLGWRVTRASTISLLLWTTQQCDLLDVPGG